MILVTKTNNDISKLIEIMTCEFKTPLTSVLFNIQSINKILNEEIENSSELLKSKIETIEAKANHMSRLIEHLLDMAQTQISEIQMRKNLTHTHDLLSEVIISSKKLNVSNFIQVENHEKNEYCSIHCDKDRLRQVFDSVVSNLIDFNKKARTIKLITKTIGNYARFIIKDEGNILEPNYLNTLFDKFRHAETKNNGKMSLGLALSKWIIEAHHGKIWIESRSDLGTAFFIDLPKMNLDELKASLEKK